MILSTTTILVAVHNVQAEQSKIGTTESCRMSLVWALLKLNPISQERYLGFVEEYCPEVEVYVPRYECRVRVGGARRPVRIKRPVYPGYVFSRVDWGSGQLREMCSLPVKAYWVRFGKKIEPIPDDIIRKLRTLEKTNGLVIEVKNEKKFKKGAMVRVLFPVADIFGVVVGFNEYSRVWVDVPLGRIIVPVHILQGVG